MGVAGIVAEEVRVRLSIEGGMTKADATRVAKAHAFRNGHRWSVSAVGQRLGEAPRNTWLPFCSNCTATPAQMEMEYEALYGKLNREYMDDEGRVTRADAY